SGRGRGGAGARRVSARAPRRPAPRAVPPPRQRSAVARSRRLDLVPPGAPACAGPAAGKELELRGPRVHLLESLVGTSRLLRMTPPLGLDHRIDPIRTFRRWEAALASDEQELMTVAAPDAKADPILDPDEVRLVLEAPG